MTERRRKFNCPTSATSSTVTWSTTTCSSRVRRSPQSAAAGTRIEDVLVTGLGAILAVEVLAALWFVLGGLLKIREYHSLNGVVAHEHHHPAHARERAGPAAQETGWAHQAWEAQPVKERHLRSVA
jgi:hypothetical protein